MRHKTAAYRDELRDCSPGSRFNTRLAVAAVASPGVTITPCEVASPGVAITPCEVAGPGVTITPCEVAGP